MSTTGAKKAKALEPGQTVAERYLVKRVLGQGGMGQVLEVEHIALGRPFALKVLRLERLTDELVRRFNREARALGSVTSPRVAQVTDFGIDSQAGPFYVMELLEGETLEDRLERETRMSVVEALTIVAELAGALADVHAAGIVHRDLKPSNVGLPSVGPVRVKLLDFGLAASMDDAFLSRITQSHQILGSLPYMAPEQFNGAEPAVAMDIYALGILLYECLTGQMPFMALNTAALIHHILSTPVPALPAELAAIPFLDVLLGRLLAKDASDRIPSATAAADAIRNLLGDQAPPRPVTRPAMGRAAMPHTMQAPLPRPPPGITESGTRPSAPSQAAAPAQKPMQVGYPPGQFNMPQPSLAPAVAPSFGGHATPNTAPAGATPIIRSQPIVHSQPGAPSPTAPLMQVPVGVSVPGYAPAGPQEPSIGLRIAVASGVGIILATVTAIAVAMALTVLDDRTGSSREEPPTLGAPSAPPATAATAPQPPALQPHAPQPQTLQPETPQPQTLQVEPEPLANRDGAQPAQPRGRRPGGRGRRAPLETGRYTPQIRRLAAGPDVPTAPTVRPPPSRLPPSRPPPPDPSVIREF